jgi:chemotaxis protein CheX
VETFFPNSKLSRTNKMLNEWVDTDLFEIGGTNMSISSHVTSTLNATIESIKMVIPLNITVSKPEIIDAPLHSEMGVLIGITGEIRGRILFQGPVQTFSSIGATMFGMALEGDMLESFAGELGNMIAGSISTVIYQGGTTIDITPPTVIVGNSRVSGFNQGVRIPADIECAGEFNIVLMIEG